MEFLRPSMHPFNKDRLMRNMNTGITTSKQVFNKKLGIWSFLDALIGLEVMTFLSFSVVVGSNSDNFGPV